MIQTKQHLLAELVFLLTFPAEQIFSLPIVITKGGELVLKVGHLFSLLQIQLLQGNL